MRVTTSHNGREHGFSLIEVLIALLVLSIGLLGLAMLQVQGMQFNNDAYLRTQASLYAYEIIDRMRANPDQASAGSYHVPDDTAVATKRSAYDTCISDGTCDCIANACNGGKLATFDIGQWYEEQTRVLPPAPLPSTIEKVGNEHRIVLRWMERDIEVKQEWVVEL